MRSGKIGIVSIGAGNIGSVSTALSFLGANPSIVSDGKSMAEMDALVLPGVGSFSCSRNIGTMRGALLEAISKKPFLGICLGMQLLFEGSEEAEGSGLGILKGGLSKLKCRKVPHVGWNALQAAGASRLLAGVEDEAFYFCHSFAVKECVSASAFTQVENEKFVSAVEIGNVFGTQFHPEKSGKAGLAVLGNFLEAVRECR